MVMLDFSLTVAQAALEPRLSRVVVFSNSKCGAGFMQGVS